MNQREKHLKAEQDKQDKLRETLEYLESIKKWHGRIWDK